MREIPTDLRLSEEDILHLSNHYLALLTATDPSNFSAWARKRHISERKLGEIAQRIGVSKGVLLAALDAKRRVHERARLASAKAERLLQFLNQQSEEVA